MRMVPRVSCRKAMKAPVPLSCKNGDGAGAFLLFYMGCALFRCGYGRYRWGAQVFPNLYRKEVITVLYRGVLRAESRKPESNPYGFPPGTIRRGDVIIIPSKGGGRGSFTLERRIPAVTDGGRRSYGHDLYPKMPNTK